LSLASLQHHFGHSEEAALALLDVVKLSQRTNDSVARLSALVRSLARSLSG
jgi:hypothetical protein